MPAIQATAKRRIHGHRAKQSIQAKGLLKKHRSLGYERHTSHRTVSVTRLSRHCRTQETSVDTGIQAPEFCRVHIPQNYVNRQYDYERYTGHSAI
jgi:hypothetical protein